MGEGNNGVLELTGIGTAEKEFGASWSGNLSAVGGDGELKMGPWRK